MVSDLVFDPERDWDLDRRWHLAQPLWSGDRGVESTVDGWFWLWAFWDLHFRGLVTSAEPWRSWGGALVDREQLLGAGTQSFSNPAPMHRRHACFPGEYWQPCFLPLQRVQVPGFAPAPNNIIVLWATWNHSKKYEIYLCLLPFKGWVESDNEASASGSLRTWRFGSKGSPHHVQAARNAGRQTEPTTCYRLCIHHQREGKTWLMRKNYTSRHNQTYPQWEYHP